MEAVFVHFGLHKTATTFMQQSVFPRFENIHFISNYPTVTEIRTIFTTNRSKLLVSREGFLGRPSTNPYREDDNDWVGDCRAGLQHLTSICPHVRLLVSFRRQDALLLSLYKQYLHNGGTMELEEEFFDIRGDTGQIKKRDLFFFPRVEAIESLVGATPFVFFQEEVRSSLPELLHDLGEFLGEDPPDAETIEDRDVGLGVRYHQARLLRLLNAADRHVPLRNRLSFRLRLDPATVCRRWLRDVSQRPLKMSSEYQDAVLEHYESDWLRTLEYARKARNKTEDWSRLLAGSLPSD